MKLIAFSLIVALLAGNVIADESTTPIVPGPPTARIQGINEISGGRNGWDSSRHYQDPQALVRKKAEMRSAQRQMRLELNKRYGHSPQRPNVFATPFTGVYFTNPRVVRPEYTYRGSAYPSNYRQAVQLQLVR
ncbi:MAG: hypothetical protein ACI9G1_004765 [Pirellulaceae bacterium]|jgi:hypothetical protein